jgi:protein-S-isoprenylcysteine O-methyltransferase Ste14
MQFLELKIPPPLVALAAGFGMWLLARSGPVIPLPDSVRIPLAALLAMAGLAIAMSGALSFRRARTTVNPLKPEAATALVSSGIYALTRNPMYLGLFTLLLGWAACLCAPLALLGPLAFWLYITRFQIVPEERALSSLFGASFTAYTARVRRWL